jgi:hypothetical protein
MSIFDSNIFDSAIFDVGITITPTSKYSSRGSDINKIPNLNTINISIGYVDDVMKTEKYILTHSLPIEFIVYFLNSQYNLENIKIEITEVQ